MRLLAPALGVVAALVYLITRAPGLYYTDTGELAAACATLGIAHPTGYPLFTLLGHAWSMLPWPSVIIGLGILNALVVGAGVMVMAYVVRDVLRRIGHADDAPTLFISLGAAGLMGFSAVAWDAATAIEVYGLHILLLAVTLAPFGFGLLGAIYGAAALGLGIAFIWYATQLRGQASLESAWQLFHFSIVYLQALFGFMVVDRLVLP